MVDSDGFEVVTKEQILAVQDAMLAEEQPKPVLVLMSGALDGISESGRQLLSNRDDVVICDDDMPKIDAVNVGAIGHVDYGKTALSAAIGEAVRTNKSDRKRNRANRWR